MAYKKRRQYRRSNKTNYLQNASSAISLASNAIRGVSMLKALVNTEFDYKDNQFLQNSPATGQINLINGMQTGDGPSDRTGTSIKNKSIELRYTINNNTTAINTQLRCMVVLDKQPNGILPNLTDILVINNVTSPRNLNNRKRFKILSDKSYSLSTAGPANCADKYYTKDMNLHTQFFASSNLGTIADISSCALYFVHLSDQPTNFPTVNWYSRVRYIDN